MSISVSPATADTVQAVAFLLILAVIIGILVALYFKREADLQADEREPDPVAMAQVRKLLDQDAEHHRRVAEFRAMRNGVDYEEVWGDSGDVDVRRA